MATKYRNLWYNTCKYLLSFLPSILFHNAVGFIMHGRFHIRYHWMNINHPKTFSEKIQYLKKHPVCSNVNKLADKLEVRDFVAHVIGEQYLIPLIGVYESVEAIDFSTLPKRFVMKLTKGSGYNLICDDKDKIDMASTKKMLALWLNVNAFYFSREPQYKGKPKLVCEVMLEYNITDYKFFCFHGEPTYIELYMDRLGNHKKVFYDMSWKKMPFTTAGDICDTNVKQPKEFQEMFSVAKKLSKGLAFVRVDLYVHAGRVYFGELTFCPAGGYTPITPREWEYKLGDKIRLNDKL